LVATATPSASLDHRHDRDAERQLGLVAETVKAPFQIGEIEDMNVLVRTACT
jgi:hypothetical protein